MRTLDDLAFPDDAVPLIEPVHAEDLVPFLRSQPMQELMGGRTDFAQATRAKSYLAQACFWRGRRLIRVSANPELSTSELTFVLCHELAHHMVGLTEKHSDEWRRECMQLVREAGELGLLSGRRVAQAVDMLRYGPVSKFRGWPERAREIKHAK